MSCFGNIKSEAVKCNNLGVPTDLELSESPTEKQIFNELENLVRFSGKRFNEFGEAETFKLEGKCSNLVYQQEYIMII